MVAVVPQHSAAALPRPSTCIRTFTTTSCRVWIYPTHHSRPEGDAGRRLGVLAGRRERTSTDQSGRELGPFARRLRGSERADLADDAAILGARAARLHDDRHRRRGCGGLRGPERGTAGHRSAQRRQLPKRRMATTCRAFRRWARVPPCFARRRAKTTHSWPMSRSSTQCSHPRSRPNPSPRSYWTASDSETARFETPHRESNFALLAKSGPLLTLHSQLLGGTPCLERSNPST